MSAPDYSGYEGETPQVDLARVQNKAVEMLEAQEAVNRAEEQLEKARERFKNLSENVLPELLDGAQIPKLTLPGGVELEIADLVTGSIRKGREAEAFEVMEKMGHGDIVKRFFTIKFGRGDQSWARKFAADLRRRKKKVNCQETQKVESATLAKFVRDRLKEGRELPDSCFSIFQRRVAKLNFPKK